MISGSFYFQWADGISFIVLLYFHRLLLFSSFYSIFIVVSWTRQMAYFSSFYSIFIVVTWSEQMADGILFIVLLYFHRLFLFSSLSLGESKWQMADFSSFYSIFIVGFYFHGSIRFSLL